MASKLSILDFASSNRSVKIGFRIFIVVSAGLAFLALSIAILFYLAAAALILIPVGAVALSAMGAFFVSIRGAFSPHKDLHTLQERNRAVQFSVLSFCIWLLSYRNELIYQFWIEVAVFSLVTLAVMNFAIYCTSLVFEGMTFVEKFTDFDQSQIVAARIIYIPILFFIDLILPTAIVMVAFLFFFRDNYCMGALLIDDIWRAASNNLRAIGVDMNSLLTFFQGVYGEASPLIHDGAERLGTHFPILKNIPRITSVECPIR